MSYIHHARALVLVVAMSFLALVAGETVPTDASMPLPVAGHVHAVPHEAPNLCTSQPYNGHSVSTSVQRLASIAGDSATVAVAGTRAYVGEGSSLTILDVSQPSQPARIGAFAVPSYVHAIHLQGNLAYVTSEKGGLTIFDVSDPAAAKHLGTYTPGGMSYEVRVVGIYAYLTVTGNSVTGLHILDVSNPTNPRLVGFQWTDTFAFDVAIEDNIAYVSTNYQWLKVEAIDVSNPFQPRRVAGALYMEGQGSGVQVIGQRAYIASGKTGFTILDIPDLRNGTEFKYMDPIGNVQLQAWTKDIFVEGNRAYVTRYDGYLNIFDISNERNPVMIGGFDTPNQTWEVQVSGGLVYLADGEGGLRIIDASDPSQPRQVSHYQVSSPENFKVVGDKVYIAGGDGGLEIVDISNLEQPRTISRYETLDHASDVEIVGGRAYVTNSGFYTQDEDKEFIGGAFEVVDIADPQHPRRLGQISPLKRASSVQVSGNIAYIAAFDGLNIVDVGDPGNPRIIRRLFESTDEGNPLPVFVLIRGNRAYVGFEGYPYSYAILDITDASNPVVLGSGRHQGRRIEVSGNTAFVAEGSLSIDDISNPAIPRELCDFGVFSAEDIAIEIPMIFAHHVVMKI